MAVAYTWPHVPHWGCRKQEVTPEVGADRAGNLKVTKKGFHIWYKAERS